MMKFLKRRWSWFVMGILCLFLGSNIVRSVLADAPTNPRETDRQVAAREIQAPGVNDERLAVPTGSNIGGSGIIEPRDRELRIAPAVSGRIASVLVHEGDVVQAGAVLVELERAVEEADLAATEADVEAAEAELSRLVRGNRRDDVLAAIAEAEAATARAALSRGVAERTRAANAGGGATRDELDRAERQAEVDAANAETAEARKRVAVAGTRGEDIAAARARVSAASARRDRARAALEQRTVRAPAAGEVLQVKARAGETAQPGADALVVLGDTSALRARIDIDERDLGTLRVGAAATVRVAAYPGVDFTGRVVELGRRMGRKNVRSDDPVERNDTKVLEVVVELATVPQGRTLYVGQRVMGYVSTAAAL